jgi:ATPase subunit of ABC transporter with duplicated ATPase domains
LGGRGRQISEIKASLVYKVSSRSVRVTQRNLVSKKQNKTKNHPTKQTRKKTKQKKRKKKEKKRKEKKRKEKKKKEKKKNQQALQDKRDGSNKVLLFLAEDLCLIPCTCSQPWKLQFQMREGEVYALFCPPQAADTHALYTTSMNA